MKKKYMKKWSMLNSNTKWITRPTLKNLDKIYQFVLSNSDLEKKKIPKYSYKELSDLLKIDHKQVSYACTLLIFHNPPIFKVKAELLTDGKTPRMRERIWLVRTF